MKQNVNKYFLLVLALTLTISVFGLAQDTEYPKQTETAVQQTKADSEPALTLASAERVYLNARLGATVNGGSGRAFPSADRALAGLRKAIADWRRFTIVDAPNQADLILTIVEGSRNAVIRMGVLTEKLIVTRGPSLSVDSPSLWESSSQDGGIRNYRPVANTLNEFRAAVEEYEKRLPKELIAQTRAARKPDSSSVDCGAEFKDQLDCLAHSIARLFLPEDREENNGAVKLSEATLNVSPLEMATRVSTTDFSNYIVAIQKLLHRQFTPKERQGGWDIAVVGTLQPEGKAKVHLQSRSFEDQNQLQIFYDNLLTLSSPAVKGSPLEFRVVFSVWGGSEESKTPGTAFSPGSQANPIARNPFCKEQA